MNISLNYWLLMNFSHKIYGFFKSVQRALGLEEFEIDDGSENLLKEYGLFFLIFGLLFLWMIYQSLNSHRK